MQGDPELNYAHFALQRLRILPSDLNNMSQRERAFIYASIDLRVEEEKLRLQRSDHRQGGEIKCLH